MKFMNCLSGLLIIVVSPLMLAPQAQADSPAGGKSKVEAVIPLKARAFPLQDVRLLEGPFKHAMDVDQRYLLALEVFQILPHGNG